jgi:putative transposase
MEKNYGVTVSESIARRYLKQIPPAVLSWWRNGSRNFENKCQPSIFRDYTLYKPMDIIVGDYMTQDFLLRVKDTVCRAKVVAFMDMRTRAIVGWSLQLTANSIGVALVLQQCFDTYGLPGTIYFDNGKEFKNYWLCGNEWKIRHNLIDAEDVERNIGIVTEAGVKIVFAKPYNGKAKPIERFWRTLHEWFDKFQPTYVGSNTTTRPEDAEVYLKKVASMKKGKFEEIPTFEQIEKELGHFFEWYNHEHKHTGQGMNSKTPLQVWRENEVSKRDVPAELKPYLFTHRYIKKVRSEGIFVDGMRYYAKDAIVKYMGEQVQVRMPMDNPDIIYVFSLASKPLFEAKRMEMAGDVAKDNDTIGELCAANRELAQQFNQGKNKLDKKGVRSPAEVYASNHPQKLKKVVGGEEFTEKPPQPKVKPLRLFKKG